MSHKEKKKHESDGNNSEKCDNEKFKENFMRGEIYHGVVNPEVKKSIKEKAALFKFFYFDEKLYFALFDYKCLYYSITPQEEVLKMNAELNPSLEFNDVYSLMNFLKENLIVQSRAISIKYRERNNEKKKSTIYEFNFFSKVDILSIKWCVKCMKMDMEYVEELSQLIFIYPMHNLLLGIGSLINNEGDTLRINGRITYEDAKLMLKCNYLGKKCGFTQSIIKLLNLSANVVNGGKYNTILDNGEEKKNKGKGTKFGGPGKKKKVEKMEFTFDYNEPITQESSENVGSDNIYKENPDRVKKKKKKAFL